MNVDGNVNMNLDGNVNTSGNTYLVFAFEHQQVGDFAERDS